MLVDVCGCILVLLVLAFDYGHALDACASNDENKGFCRSHSVVFLEVVELNCYCDYRNISD